MSIATVIDEATLATATAATKTLTMGVSPGPFAVIWTVRDATAVGDLGATNVRPVAKDGTVLPISLTPTTTEAAVLSGGIAVKVDYFDVPGIEKIWLSVTNGAGADRNVVVDVGYHVQ